MNNPIFEEDKREDAHHHNETQESIDVHISSQQSTSGTLTRQRHNIVSTTSNVSLRSPQQSEPIDLIQFSKMSSSSSLEPSKDIGEDGNTAASSLHDFELLDEPDEPRSMLVDAGHDNIELDGWIASSGRQMSVHAGGELELVKLENAKQKRRRRQRPGGEEEERMREEASNPQQQQQVELAINKSTTSSNSSCDELDSFLRQEDRSIVAQANDRSLHQSKAMHYRNNLAHNTLAAPERRQNDDSKSHYEDFQTIDWLRDIARDRHRHRAITRSKNSSLFTLLWSTHDAWAGWLCVLLVGVCSGWMAGIIDIGAGWMKDLKNGICPAAFYLNREQCCWSSNDTELEDSLWTQHCDQWKTWPELFGLGATSSPFFSYVVGYFFYIIWALVFALLAACFVRTFAPYACGSGIPEIKTILSGFIIRGYLGSWTLTVKSVGMMLAVASGLSLGKEGPMVHCSCCIGNIISRLFQKYGGNEAKKREILSAASAAGVSVAFGAPIGGVLFSLEEVSYYFPLKTLWRSFFCALIAAFVLRMINPFGNDHLVMFYIDQSRPWAFIELIAFVMLGVIGGVIGNVFIKSNIRWCQMRKLSWLGQYPLCEILGVSLVTSVLAYPNPFTRMNSSDLIKLLFSSCGVADDTPLCDYYRNFTNVNQRTAIAQAGTGVYTSLGLLMLALFFKLVITIFTFGIRVPAGLFIPSLAMGAIVGRIVGTSLEQIAYNYPDWWFYKTACSTSSESCISPGLYAVVGAAAVLGGVTRMTISLVVIMFELTGNVNFIVPLMAAIMTAKWVGDALGKQGIYDAHIQLNGYPFLDNKEEFAHTTTASDAMRPKLGEPPLAVLTEDSLTVGDIQFILKSTAHKALPVVVNEHSRSLVGFVSRLELVHALTRARASAELFDSTPVYFRSFTNEEAICFAQAREKAAPANGKPFPLNFKHYIDLAPVTVADQTPMEMVIDMFRKLGLRQVLVIHNGVLLGIITKKDILLHMKEYEQINPNHSPLVDMDAASVIYQHNDSYLA